MARQDLLRLFCFSLLVCDLVGSAYSSSFGFLYEEYGLDSERICHPLVKKTTIAIRNRTTAVIVKPNHVFDQWYVSVPKHCKFVFKAEKGDGLVAVIQKMSFRTNISHCIDYVQFKRKDNHWTQKFCGNFHRSKDTPNFLTNSDESMYPSYDGNFPIYAEYDPSDHRSGGELETEIYISKEKLRDGETLDLSIVYTPYKNCSTVNPEKYKSIGYKACIHKELFCDGFYNCIPDDFCNDENDCLKNPHEIVSSGAGTNVTVGAVTTMILCFVIFVMCLWICKRSQKLCWSSDCAGPQVCSRPGTLSREPGVYEHRPVSTRPPTAPMLEVAVTPSVADKDLPPSYDSLFPEQSNPVRS